MEAALSVFKILAIDGGGIRGFYSAKLLEVFEDRFKTRIADHFDLVCGTSTGGLIALALAMGFPASTISEFYKKYGDQIFPPSWRLWRRTKQIVGHGKYSNETLRSVLEQFFGDTCVGDSQCLLCIPSYSVTHARPYIFRFDHPEGGLGRDNNTRCVEVALATSAAPTYFPLVEIPHHPGQFIDGGVCANNPAIVGLIEAFRYFVGAGKAYASVEVLSIETLSVPVGMRLQKRREKGALHWREDLISCFMEGQEHLTNYTLKTFSDTAVIPLTYTRLESPRVSPEQAKLLSLDNAEPEALAQLEAFGVDAAHNFSVQDRVRCFFNTKKTYKTQGENMSNGEL
jgi:predicted acylesterase/phospholipase RssA